MSHASQREGAKSPSSYKEEPAPVAVDVSELPVIPTLCPSLSPIRTKKPLLFHLHTQGQLLLAALSYPLLYSSAPQPRPDQTRPRSLPCLPPSQPFHAGVLAVAAHQRLSRQANKSRCSLTAFRVCIRCLHISLHKTPHNGPSRYPSSSASLATWYALFFAKCFSPCTCLLSASTSLPKCTPLDVERSRLFHPHPPPCSTSRSAVPCLLSSPHAVPRSATTTSIPSLNAFVVSFPHCLSLHFPFRIFNSSFILTSVTNLGGTSGSLSAPRHNPKIIARTITTPLFVSPTPFCKLILAA